jgi:predicted RND superfamily exporter protein
MLGFLIFLVSDFLPLFYFGLLTSIAMLAWMIGDVVLLPCLLRTFDEAKWRNAPKSIIVESTNWTIQTT